MSTLEFIVGCLVLAQVGIIYFLSHISSSMKDLRTTLLASLPPDAFIDEIITHESLKKCK